MYKSSSFCKANGDLPAKLFTEPAQFSMQLIALFAALYLIRSTGHSVVVTAKAMSGHMISSSLLQVGHKSFMYMHLYAEATLALVETPHKEIQFKQITGDFQTLQGKIMIQQDTFSSVQTTSLQTEIQ